MKHNTHKKVISLRQKKKIILKNNNFKKILLITMDFVKSNQLMCLSCWQHLLFLNDK